jgi:class 3 adenylate cyclase
LFDRSNEAPLQAMTTALGDLAAARRTSVWRLSEGGRQLHCQDACERDAGGHVAGVKLSRAELPQFFEALEAGDEIRVPDAGKDRRTADLHRALMHPIDSRGLDVVPVRGSNNVVGAILLEDAAHMSGAREFAALFANVLAARMGDGMEPAAPTPEKANATPPTAGEKSSDADLVVQGMDHLAPGAELFPSAAVMSVKFGDAAALAAPAPDGATTLADRIAVALQEIAAAHHIPYVKLVGRDMVAAAGLVAKDTTALLRIADAAIETRERCLELFEAGGHAPSFRIGIGCGVAVGGHVGQEPRLFNLWGHAVHIAELLAETGSGPGTIQVSEVAHAQLRDHFLFRPRGNFYLPHLGTRQTFVLGSRQ